MPQEAGNLIQNHQLRRVADRNHQHIVVQLQRHKVEAKHQLDRHRPQQIVLDFKVFEIRKLRPVPPSHLLRLRPLIQPSRKRPILWCRNDSIRHMNS